MTRERSAVAERLANIRGEIQSEALPPWAGEYSWTWETRSVSCGNVPRETFYEGLVLAPNGGAVWWFGKSGPAEAEFIDHGQIVSVNNDCIHVEWAISAKSPHLFSLEEPTLLLCEDLIPVRMNDRSHLVPAVRMPLFCGTSPSEWDDIPSLAPRRGGWNAFDEKWARFHGTIPPSQPPQVPIAWQEYVLASPISAEAELTGGPDLIHEIHDPPPPFPWYRTIWSTVWTDGYYRWTYSLPCGANVGLRVGMPMYFENSFGRSGVVTTVEKEGAVVEFIKLSTWRNAPSLVPDVGRVWTKRHHTN